MQTFLPYADFLKSAQSIDKKRCWKQVVEAKQIIDCLESDLTKGWKHHPAVKMWVGYIPALKFYFNNFLYICKIRHGVKTNYNSYPDITTSVEKPWWLGNEDFHRAMRARLIEKDRDFYLLLFPYDEGFNDGKYWWPVMELKTFRII